MLATGLLRQILIIYWRQRARVFVSEAKQKLIFLQTGALPWKGAASSGKMSKALIFYVSGFTKFVMQENFIMCFGSILCCRHTGNLLKYTRKQHLYSNMFSCSHVSCEYIYLGRKRGGDYQLSIPV